MSMGPIAALKAMRVAENVRYVLAIELLTAIQAIDLRKVEHLPPRTAAAHRMLRECADFWLRIG